MGSEMCIRDRWSGVEAGGGGWSEPAHMTPPTLEVVDENTPPVIMYLILGGIKDNLGVVSYGVLREAWVMRELCNVMHVPKD